MIWNNDYETLTAARRTATEKVQETMNRALEYARNNLTDGWQKDEDEFIIITVEGYSGVALITNEWEPIEICDRVFPFDENRIYPMQEIEQKIYFKTFH